VIEPRFAHASAASSEGEPKAVRSATVAQLVPRAPMMVARPSGAASSRSHEPEITPLPREKNASAARAETSRSSERLPTTLAPAELSKLTEHVMQQLDRRVLSYRERTGRL
jgi:hypothetical protein